MKNVQSPQGDRAVSLADLKAKQAELKASLQEVDAAIHAWERLLNSGVMTGAVIASSNKQGPGSLENTSVYEGAVTILAQRNQELTTNEIVDALIKGGKKLGDNARVIVATTLYKSVKMKKNCKIALSGKGLWKLA